MTARRRGAWCSCARSQRRIGGLIASPLRHREGQRLDRARAQTGHSKSGDGRAVTQEIAATLGLTVWNGLCRCGTTTPAPYREVRSIGPLRCSGPALDQRRAVAGRLPGRLAYPGHPRRAGGRGETTQVLLPRLILAARPRNHYRSHCALAANGPAAPEAEAPQRSVGQGTPCSLSPSLSVERPTSRRTPAETEPGELSSAT